MNLRHLPLLAGLTTLVLTALIAWVVHVDEQTRRRDRLSVAAQRIEKRVANNILALHAIRGAVNASRAAPSRTFLADLVAALPEQDVVGGVQGFAFAVASAPGDSDRISDLIARGYGISRSVWPATDQSIRYPVALIEPMGARNERALGYDLFSETLRREALLAAERTGRPAATRPLRLVQEEGMVAQAGILIALPLFARDGMPAPSLEMPPERATGFVTIVIRIDDLVNHVMSKEPAIEVGLDLYDREVGPDQLIYRSETRVRSGVSIPLSIADRTWVAVLSDAPQGWMRFEPALIVALIGVLLAGALAGLLGEHFRKVAAKESLAAETLKRIEQQEILLGESQHRIKNSIARKLALFRMSVRETHDRESLIQMFESRLHSMARAQDLLRSEPGGAMPISRFLDQEIGMWPGQEHVSWGGPDLRLGGRQIQALCLIVHEMATNSLKYGALAQGKSLDIRWSVDESVNPPLVTFLWREAVEPTAQRQPTKAGFGSRLIRMMVETQLGGRQERLHENGELRLAISFPIVANDVLE